MSPFISMAIVVAYVLVMLSVGWFSMRKTRDVKDFFIGGRTLGPWMSAFAYGTTYFSAVLFIGYAGKLGWGFGIHTMWIVLGNTVVGTFLAWKVLAGRTREMTARLSAITMPEFLRARFDSPALQVFAATVMFVFLVPYSASVLMGLSYLFEMTLHLPYETALFLLTALTAIYLVMGGYFAVAISDFVRGIIEFTGVMIMVWLLAHRSGIGGFVAAAVALLRRPQDQGPGPRLAQGSGGGPAGDRRPRLAHPRFARAHHELGALGAAADGPEVLLHPQPQGRQAGHDHRRRLRPLHGLRRLLQRRAHPPVLRPQAAPGAHGTQGARSGTRSCRTSSPPPACPSALVMVIVLMVFSASMSSLSSLVLVSSSAVAIDIYGAFVDHEKNPKRTMGLMRVLCAVFVALSLFIALAKPAVIVNLMIMSWGTLSGVFLAPYLYGLFWRGVTRAGVWAGMITGLVTAVFLFFAWGADGVPLAGAVAMLLPLAVVPAVSVATRAPKSERLATAFGDPAAEGPGLSAEG